jgi:hypothetical protein
MNDRDESGCESAREDYLQMEALPTVRRLFGQANEHCAFTRCDCCGNLPRVLGSYYSLRGRLADGLDASVVLSGIAKLHRVGLVSCSEPVEGSASRRSLLRAAGAAIPIVLSLTASEQKAFAQAAGSGPGVARLLSVSPTFVAACGIPTQVVITGQNTNFTNASVITVAGVAEVSVTNVVANSPTSLTATLTLANNQLGLVNVTVTTGSQVATGTGLINLAACS